MLSDDMYLRANWSSLDFDNWLLAKSTKDGHRGKTGYKLMMAVFGGKFNTPRKKNNRLQNGDVSKSSMFAGVATPISLSTYLIFSHLCNSYSLTNLSHCA